MTPRRVAALALVAVEGALDTVAAVDAAVARAEQANADDVRSLADMEAALTVLAGSTARTPAQRSASHDRADAARSGLRALAARSPTAHAEVVAAVCGARATWGLEVPR